MKAFAILLLASLPVPQVPLPRATATQAEPHFVQHASATQHKSGKWYFARTGHAVFCYGPVMTVPNRAGEIERVATFCRGGEVLVPLKD